VQSDNRKKLSLTFYDDLQVSPHNLYDEASVRRRQRRKRWPAKWDGGEGGGDKLTSVVRRLIKHHSPSNAIASYFYI
jgi:hypothetical protein